MFSSVAMVRRLCAERNIPIAQLERELGFANGYLNPKKMSRLPYDRSLMIAQYLDVPVEIILTGHEPVSAEPRDPDVLERVDVAFYGQYRELTEHDREIIRGMVRLMRQRQEYENT